MTTLLCTMCTIKYRLLLFSISISYICCEGMDNNTKSLPALNETARDRLRQHLLLNYDKLSRPDEYWNKTVVTVYFSVYDIKLDDAKSIMSVTGAFILVYKDRKLRWNDKEYEGIHNIRVEYHETWSPDIHLFNSAGHGMQTYGNVRKVVHSDGSVIWVPWTTFQGYCQLDFRHWPFDRNKCSLMLGSWTYHADEIELNFKKNYSLLVNKYVPSGEWVLESTDIGKRLIHYSCCKEPFLILNYDFHLKRSSNFYSYILTAPTVPIVILALSIFWLDPRSTLKLIINGFQLGYISMFLLYLGIKIPPEIGSVPSIARFYSGCAYQIAISAFLSIFAINFVENTSTPFPSIIKSILTGSVGNYLGLCDIIAKIEDQKLSMHILKNQNQDLTTIKKGIHDLEWILFISALDRISFLFFCGMFSVMAIRS